MKKILIFLMLSTAIGCKEREDVGSKFNIEVDGYKEGLHIVDSAGILQSLLRYHKGELDGECTWYHSNGRIRSKVSYQDGKEDGMAYYFYPSGVIECFREWKNGLKVGYAVDYYDSTGDIKAALYYEQGVLLRRKVFDRQGKLIREE